MDKRIILIALMLVGSSFSACYNVASIVANSTTDINPLTYDCIYDMTNNVTYNITIPKSNNLIPIDFTHNGTDIQNNTYFANRASIDASYRTNDIVSVPWNGTVTNNITNTVYNVALLPDTRVLIAGAPAVNIRGVSTSCNLPSTPAINTTLDIGQTITVNNNTIICRLQQQQPINLTSPQTLSLFNGSQVVNCRDNIPRNLYISNVSVYNISNANITVSCLQNIEKNLTDGEVYVNNVTNETVRQFSYKQNLVWNMTLDSVQMNNICNITAYAPTSSSIKQNNNFTINLSETKTDPISGNRYTGISLDNAPYRKTNILVNFTAPQVGVEPLTNTTFSCNVRTFPTNVSYQIAGGTSKFFAPVSLDYFNTYCTEEEKQELDLAKCVERRSSPEVWSQRLNATEQLVVGCNSEKLAIQQNATNCNAALQTGKAASDNMLLLVAGLFSAFMVVAVIAGIIIYYKKIVKPPTKTQRPVPSRGMPMDEYFSDPKVIQTKPDSNNNKLFLPEGFDE